MLSEKQTWNYAFAFVCKICTICFEFLQNLKDSVGKICYRSDWCITNTGHGAASVKMRKTWVSPRNVLWLWSLLLLLLGSLCNVCFAVSIHELRIRIIFSCWWYSLVMILPDSYSKWDRGVTTIFIHWRHNSQAELLWEISVGGGDGGMTSVVFNWRKHKFYFYLIRKRLFEWKTAFTRTYWSKSMMLIFLQLIVFWEISIFYNLPVEQQ